MEKFVPNKKQGQQIHTKRRAKERYGLNLNKDDRRAITQRIKDSLKKPEVITPAASANFLVKHSNRVSEWEVPYAEKNLRVLYDSKRSSIITCLPPLEEKETEDGEEIDEV